MEKEIWKFQLEKPGVHDISIPIGSELLTVQVQQGIVCLWAIVEPNAEKVLRSIEVVGTGVPIDREARMKYIGTIQLYSGSLVFHVFDLGEKPCTNK